MAKDSGYTEVMRTRMGLASLLACLNNVAAARVSLLAGNGRSRRRLLNSRRDGQRRNLHDIAIER